MTDETEMEKGAPPGRTRGDGFDLARPVPRVRRTLVVVIDQTDECNLAVRFASRRASHLTGGHLVLFHCIPPGDFQHWMSVADRMREEAHEDAEVMMNDQAVRIEEERNLKPEVVITHGNPAAELHKYMQGCEDLFGLVLAVGSGSDPGPLVNYFTREHAQDLTCPVFLIPGSMTFEMIDKIA